MNIRDISLIPGDFLFSFIFLWFHEIIHDFLRFFVDSSYFWKFPEISSNIP